MSIQEDGKICSSVSQHKNVKIGENGKVALPVLVILQKENVEDKTRVCSIFTFAALFLRIV